MNFFIESFVSSKMSIFPLIARSKKPATKNGFKDASRDPQQIQSWFPNGAERNVGIVTGSENKIGVIDVDPKNGGDESYKKLRTEYGLDIDTVVVETGSGGFHLYYKALEPVRSRIGILPGIDIKGDGGYVVAPPSVHPNGKPYVFLNGLDFSKMKDFPYELIKKLDPELKKSSSLMTSAKVGEGARHDYIVKRVGELKGFGFSQSEIESRIHDENIKKCAPPLDSTEVDAILNSIPERVPDEVMLYAPHTDLGNAERYKARYDGQAIFVTAMDKWFIYDGKRFVEDVSRASVLMAKRLLRSGRDLATGLGSEANDLRETLSKHLRKSEAKARVMAMLDLAQSEMAVSPKSLDSDPFLLNVSNGTLQLRSGRLEPHTPTKLLTKLTPINFDPNAKCPLFEKFIDDVTCGDKDLQNYLQKICGYSLTGDTREQILWIMHGLGSNGKTTFIEIMKKVFGEYGRTADISTFSYKQSEQIRNDLARLFDARVVTSAEIQEGKLLDESVIKQVTGGDPVTCRFLFKEHFEYVPRFKLFMVVNHLPHVNGTDRGMWRRINVIPFEASFEGQKKDKNLLAKLESELPGILNWAVEGCLKWQREGLVEPARVVLAGERYQLDEDSIGEFLAEMTHVGANFEVSASELFGRFAEQQKAHGHRVISQKLFAQKLAIKGFQKKRGDRGRIFYLGLKLKLQADSVC